MTLREKICEAGVSTFREFVCLGIGEGGGADRLIPYDDLVLDIQIDRMSVDMQKKKMTIEVQRKEIDAELLTKYLTIDIENKIKEVDNGCS